MTGDDLGDQKNNQDKSTGLHLKRSFPSLKLQKAMNSLSRSQYSFSIESIIFTQ